MDVKNAELAKWYESVPRTGALVGKCQMHLPEHLEGMTVLDIGCRSGKGVFQIAEHTGENGYTIGIEWDQSMVDDANAKREKNASKLGYAQPNTDFRFGFPEDLAASGIEDCSIDAVIVNCVLNLAFDREQALAEMLRALKPGGLLYHATVVADHAIGKDVMEAEAREGDAIGSAFTADALDDLLCSVGFIDIEHPEIAALQADDRPHFPLHREYLESFSFEELTISAHKPT